MEFSSKKNREDGSGTMAVIALLAALGMTTTYVLQQGGKVTSAIQRAKSIENTRATNIANMNSLARIRSLISTKKMPDNTYKPSLVGVNYWATNWSLASNPSAPATEADILGTGNKVKMKSIQIDDKDDVSVGNVLSGSAPLLGLVFDETMIDILRTTFDADQKLALSVDVKVTSQQQIKGQSKKIESVARIPLTAPEPYNPILEISPTGANAWSTNFANLPVGNYDLRVLASGIAFDAVISINGMPDITVGGFDVNGAAISLANNYLAVNAEVGRTTVPLGGGGGSVVACVFVPGNNTFTISLKINGPGGGAVPSANIANYSLTTAGGSVGPPLSDAASDLVCNAQCPTLVVGGDDWAESAVTARFTARNYGDYTNKFYTQNARPSWNVADKKLCGNAVVAAALQNAEVGSFPDTRGQISTANGELGWEWYTYNPTTCARSFLMARGGCGCFADDTKILLGDGKTEKRITELTTEDMIWNPIAKKAMAIEKMTEGPEPIPMLEVFAAGKSVKVTGKHPFPTPEGVRTAFTLQVGDKIKTSGSHNWVEIEKIQVVSVSEGKPPVVWNLELKGSQDESDHYIVADGIITGDLYLQRLLEVKVAAAR